MITICLDPGHPSYPRNEGCVANGLKEFEYTWQFYEKLTNILIKINYPIVLACTRTSQVQVVRLKERARIAHSIQSDLVISIHVNSFTTDKLHGAMAFAMLGDDQARMIGDVFLRSCPNPLYVEGRKTEIINQNSIVHTYQNNIRNVLGDYGPIPAVLLELGFTSNPIDREALLNNNIQYGLISACIVMLTEFRRIADQASYNG